ncbi:MAG: Crp/Fnr family transcriptional regulator [Bacteroidales bacterium]|nr:Crp/Fnr family transcriptional regulator [Bacteroidales bacterium]
MEEARVFLKKIFVNEALVDELMAGSQKAEIPSQQTILREGEYIKVVPFVFDGRIKVMRQDESGKEVLLYYIQPGESCALSIAAGLNHEKSVAYAITDRPTSMLAIPTETLREMLLKFPRLNDFVLHLFHQRFNELILFIDAVSFKNVDFRLIVNLKNRQKESASNTIWVTHQQLANELGTAREVVSRLLKQLERGKKIRNLRGKIEIIAPL